MKTLKYLSSLFLIAILISCTSTTISSNQEDNLTVYIDCNTLIKSSAEEKISSDISKISRSASKNADSKKEKANLQKLQKNIKNNNYQISVESNEELTSHISDTLKNNGYTISETLNARYTLTCNLDVMYENNSNTDMYYTFSLNIFDEVNIPKDFNPDAKLQKYDNKLSNATHIDTKQFNNSNNWTMNGFATGKDLQEAYQKMIHDIEKNIDRTFAKVISI